MQETKGNNKEQKYMTLKTKNNKEKSLKPQSVSSKSLIKFINFSPILINK